MSIFGDTAKRSEKLDRISLIAFALGSKGINQAAKAALKTTKLHMLNRGNAIF